MHKKRIVPLRFAPVALACAAMLVAVPAFSQGGLNCGSLENNYGPYDYTNPIHVRELLPRVEQYHFDVGVRSLEGLRSLPDGEFRLGADIGYTLRAFPNHHLALYTMVRYYLEKVPGGSPRMRYDPLCWFDRAKRFAPSDATVVMIEGIWFHKTDNLPKARRAYETALEMAPNSAEINYNAGLFFIEIEDYDRAMECATRAYGSGHPLPGLRNRLIKLGAWKAES